MAEKPEIFALSRLPWQLFCTMTFVRQSMPMGLCRKYWFAFLRQTAENFGVHFSNVLWLLRSEHGETTGRFHYHALIGGLPPHVLTEATCFSLMAQWEHLKPLVWREKPRARKTDKREFAYLSKFCGMARIRIYQSGMDGLDYFLPDTGLCGDVHPSGRSRSAANTYEVNKFGKADSVEFSESCARVIAARHSRGTAKTLQSTQSEVSRIRRLLPSPALSRVEVPGVEITRQTSL